MKLTAVFESWHIGDGNYPPLRRGQLVNLSFEFEPSHVEEAGPDSPERFDHLGDGEYRFCGRVLRVYTGRGRQAVVVFESEGFRFYVMPDEAGRYAPGRRFCGAGTLLLDHYYWVEFLREYEDPPDLFYDLAVSRIRKVSIPERLVARDERGKSHPTRLAPGDYSASDVEELETMEGQPFDEEFYLLDFDGAGTEGASVPRTFLG